MIITFFCRNCDSINVMIIVYHGFIHIYQTGPKWYQLIIKYLARAHKIRSSTGSILGPLMFLIFINDLPLVLENTIISMDLYADDTTVYVIQTNMQTLERKLIFISK